MRTLPRPRELARRALDAFLLREAERRASALSEVQQRGTARLHAAAMGRVRVARELEHAEPLAAIALYREAAAYLIGAAGQGLREDLATTPPHADEAWSELPGLPAFGGARRTPAGWDRARELLGGPDPLAPDDLSRPEQVAAAAVASHAVDYLAAAVEPRTPREIRFTRWVRVIAVPLGVLLTPFLLHAAVVLSRKNLALGMPATASSQRPGTPQAGGVDNGVLEPNYGVHTNTEHTPWVRIDLGASSTIHEVRVFNRGDGYESEILPLNLQLSDDDTTWVTVAERTDEFRQDRPWIAKIDPKPARYVRIFMPKDGYIALSEIEVY